MSIEESEPMQLNAAQIRTILVEGREEGLIGIPETQDLDFKETVYALHDASSNARRHHAWELAKDVSAMANSPNGGCIVIGVRTEPHPTSNEDVAAEVKPFPCDLLDQQQYNDAIAENAYPIIKGVEVLKYERDDKCLALIVVPPQDQDDGTFLLKKIVDPDGTPTEGFAIPVRDGSHTRWQPIGMIHRDIADGKRTRRGIGASGGDSASVAQAQASLEARITADLTEIENYMDWHDAAIYALAAAPLSPPDRIENFYGGDLKQHFAMPPEIRHAGFGMGYRQEPTPEHGGLVAVDADFRYRRLEPDGYLLVALKAEENILGRTSRQPTGVPRPLNINVVALIEFTYEFCRFQSTILGTAIESEWSLALLVRGAKSRSWSLRIDLSRLPSSRIDFLRSRTEPHEAQDDEWVQVIDASDDHAENAFKLLARVCDLFGQPESDLPLVSDGRVDEQAIKDLG